MRTKEIISEPFTMLATLLDRDNFMGRVITGRIQTGKIKINDPIKVLNSDGEVVETGMVVIAGNMFVHDAPQSFNRVQMRCIGRQEMQFYPSFRCFQPRLQDLRMVIAGIIEIHMNNAL